MQTPDFSLFHFYLSFKLVRSTPYFSVFTFHLSLRFVRYFIELQYDGAAYCGWQRQPDAITVQGVIEEKLSMLLRVPTEIVGAGRTDTGVNASYYVAHFDSETSIDAQQLCYKLNKVLPADIAIISIREVSETLHARFDAKLREYTYFLTPHSFFQHLYQR